MRMRTSAVIFAIAVAVSCAAAADDAAVQKLADRAEIEARAEDIERQAVRTRAMPPGNTTGITDEERELLGAWIASR